ncbi:class II aldolase/adducin family protein [Escherichia coli]|uniref:class II aldolase/adducin family protein n=1 Tax=Escherichia coli TaxID=562 RepID=UPI0021B4745A|nr:class II aldolase/adducin family protein [Escherichia coli]
MERIKLAEKIISTCREMNASGLNQGTSGNVSARYTGGMLITPSGIAYSKMTPDMIVFVDDKGIPEAGKIPSSEWLFHLACYKARPELNAVIHTHAVNSTAVAIHNHSILKWFTEFGHLNRGDMLTSEQHRCHNEKKKFQRRV